MSRTRNFKPLFPTTGRMTLSVYQDLNNKYESNPQDLKVINNLIDVLQDYIFSVRDLIAFDDDNEIFENKKQAALKVMDIALSIKDNLSLIHISEPTRRTPISYAVFCLKKKKTQSA